MNFQRLNRLSYVHLGVAVGDFCDCAFAVAFSAYFFIIMDGILAFPVFNLVILEADTPSEQVAVKFGRHLKCHSGIPAFGKCADNVFIPSLEALMKRSVSVETGKHSVCPNRAIAVAVRAFYRIFKFGRDFPEKIPFTAMRALVCIRAHFTPACRAIYKNSHT